MFLSDLLVKWSESFEIFKKKELKLFSLLVLNSFRRSLYFLVKQVWWVLILLLILFNGNVFSFLNSFFYEPSTIKAFSSIRSFYSIGFVFVGLFLSFYSFLIVRPSGEAKDSVYVATYLSRLWGFVIISLFMSGLPIFPLFWIISLFFLDSENNIRSLYLALINGIKFIIYYLPIMLIFGMSKILLNYLLVKFGSILLSFMTQGTLFYILWSKVFCLLVCMVWLLFLCVMSIYYVRMKHKDFNLFSS